MLDELCDPGWNVDDENGFQTADPEEFLDVYWRSRKCMAFIDESGDAVGHYDRAMIKTATRGRHWGHTNHYLVQRALMLAPTVRAQCTRVFCFCQAEDDAKILAREFNKPELLRATELKQGEYIYAEKMGRVSFHNTGASKNAAVSDSAGSGESGRGVAVAEAEESGSEPGDGSPGGTGEEAGRVAAS